MKKFSAGTPQRFTRSSPPPTGVTRSAVPNTETMSAGRHRRRAGRIHQRRPAQHLFLRPTGLCQSGGNADALDQAAFEHDFFHAAGMGDQQQRIGPRRRRPMRAVGGNELRHERAQRDTGQHHGCGEIAPAPIDQHAGFRGLGGEEIDLAHGRGGKEALATVIAQAAAPPMPRRGDLDDAKAHAAHHGRSIDQIARVLRLHAHAIADDDGRRVGDGRFHHLGIGDIAHARRRRGEAQPVDRPQPA